MLSAVPPVNLNVTLVPGPVLLTEAAKVTAPGLGLTRLSVNAAAALLSPPTNVTRELNVMATSMTLDRCARSNGVDRVELMEMRSEKLWPRGFVLQMHRYRCRECRNQRAQNRSRVDHMPDHLDCCQHIQMAGLAENTAWVFGRPPLLARGPSKGLFAAPKRLPPWSVKLVMPLGSMMMLFFAMTLPTLEKSGGFVTDLFPKRIVLSKVIVGVPLLTAIVPPFVLSLLAIVQL